MDGEHGSLTIYISAEILQMMLLDMMHVYFKEFESIDL
jgi:hypothetical protein